MQPNGANADGSPKITTALDVTVPAAAGQTPSVLAVSGATAYVAFAGTGGPGVSADREGRHGRRAGARAAAARRLAGRLAHRALRAARGRQLQAVRRGPHQRHRHPQQAAAGGHELARCVQRRDGADASGWRNGQARVERHRRAGPGTGESGVGGRPDAFAHLAAARRVRGRCRGWGVGPVRLMGIP